MNIAKYVEEHPIDIYIDYRDELGEEQIEKILEGKADEVRCDIEVNANHNEELELYWQNLCEELLCTQQELDDWLSSNEGFWPSSELSDHSWRMLLRNTRTYITCTMWDVPWEFNCWAYGQPLEYSNVKEALKILDDDKD